jgi:hypothetical protein
VCTYKTLYFQKNYHIEDDIYAVNDLDFHSSEKSMLLTAESKGTFNTRNIGKRQKLKAYNKVDGHIFCAEFNRDGVSFAYTVSNDWSKADMKQNFREYLLNQKKKRR